MKIIIGADMVPTKSNESLFKSGNIESLFGSELISFLKNADYRVFNLETPLTTSESPVKKLGPRLKACGTTINGYKGLNVDLVTLANNHIMDYGIEGLKSTISVLDTAGISYVGIGNSLKEAYQPYITQIDNKVVGFYGCVEHEFSVATEDTAGANPFDPYESYDHIIQLKNNCDIVIVLYHGGKEHYRYPSPELMKRCRKFIQKGADLVICQHSHCIGCYEKYEAGVIVYGQGNFLFDHNDRQEWQDGLLVEYTESGVQFIPVVKQQEKVRLANSRDAKNIIDQFEQRSRELKDTKLLKKIYSEYVCGLLNDYLWTITGCKKSVFLRLLNRVSGYRFCPWYMRRKYSSEICIALLNYLDCESHHEALSLALKIESGIIENERK